VEVFLLSKVTSFGFLGINLWKSKFRLSLSCKLDSIFIQIKEGLFLQINNNPKYRIKRKDY
jgi:hypothetical protein